MQGFPGMRYPEGRAGVMAMWPQRLGGGKSAGNGGEIP